MLTKIHVKNFKSLADLTLEPGTLNVLVGANGSGKSNFLEAIAFASAAADGKLDNEFLISRGIRVTAPEFMRSAFTKNADGEVSVLKSYENEKFAPRYSIRSLPGEHYPRWQAAIFLAPTTLQARTHEVSANTAAAPGFDVLLRQLEQGSQDPKNPLSKSVAKKLLAMTKAFAESVAKPPADPFLIYAPENSALRRFEQEGQILPLGINGAGLFKLLRFLSEDSERWEELKASLKLLDWVGDIRIAPEQAPFEQSLQIQDRFLNQELGFFDQRSANEGFLFLLFYFALMISSDTPSIFAIDNVDTSLNPKMATELIRRLAVLAKKYKKQVFLTTHSPAVLDGLDLADDQQRLFAFDRKRNGETRCRRVTLPQPVEGEKPVKLSEAFARGLLGGLPQNF